MRFAVAAALAAGLAAAGCRGPRGGTPPASLDAAAESYVRLVLALGERDSDSLDSYHGPAAWQAEARARHTALTDIGAAATALAESLRHQPDGVRRDFLLRQLHAIGARVDILRGARPAFDDE